MRASRIITVTVNPAIDLATAAESIHATRKIRTSDEQYFPGGGGLNVARVVQELGGSATALMLAGGITGRFLGELLDEAGVCWHAIPVNGRTRISLNIFERSTGLEYRFVPDGPVVGEEEWRALLSLVERASGAWLVASGSLGPGIPQDFYTQLAHIAQARGQNFALDTSGPALAAGLGRELTLLKPSLGEFESLCRRELGDPVRLEVEALDFVRSGAARMLAVTLGAEGAILATPEGVLRLGAPRIAVRSAVGAGDAFLAGMILALAGGLAPAAALAWGVAAGCSAVSGAGTAQVRRAEVEALAGSLAKEVRLVATPAGPAFVQRDSLKGGSA